MAAVNNKSDNATADGMVTMPLRKLYYKDGINEARLITRLSAIYGFILTALCGYCIYTHHRNDQIFFPLYEEQRLVPLTPLDKSYKSDQAVAQWSARAIFDTFKFGKFDQFRFYDALKTYFSAQGAQEFYAAMQKNDIYKDLIEQNNGMEFSLKHTPLVLKSEIEGGFYKWQVEMCGSLQYVVKRDPTYWRIVVDIYRQSEKDSVFGMVIHHAQIFRDFSANRESRCVWDG